MKCLYHLDADGKAAAYCVAKYNNNFIPDNFIMMNYGWDTKSWLSKIEKNEEVYIVDFSIEPYEMDKLLEITNNIIWIDHHISAIRKYENYPHEIAGIRYDGIAGCMLTWVYLNEMVIFDKFNPAKEFDIEMTYEAPDFISYIADHDVWKFEFGDYTKYFMLGFATLGKMLPTDVKNWSKLEGSVFCNRIVDKGSVISEYQDVMNEKNRKRLAHEKCLFGHKFLVANACGNSSFFGNTINDYEAVCLYSFDGNIWSYTFFSAKDDFDCSEFVERIKRAEPTCLSAGGHKGAAGAQFSEPYFF